MAIERVGQPLYSAAMLEETLSAPGQTEWVRLRGKVAVQITGVATAITARVQRSTRDPQGTPNTATVEEITGNPATGMEPVGYEEPAAAWWRVVVDSLTGASAEVSLSGGSV